MLGRSDLKQVIEKLLGNNKLSEREMQYLIQNILEEADLDDDGSLSFAEFEHIIDKSSDFARYLHILFRVVLYIICFSAFRIRL